MDYIRARKPLGGFILLTVTQLSMVWWAYQKRFIQLKDLRVWFAAQELVARRCELKDHQTPNYRMEELRRLVAGHGGEEDSVRRLERVGLLVWSSLNITFAREPSALHLPDLPSLHEMLSRVQNNRRKVPVPRQVVRFIASPSKRCVIAAMLGHLFRCLYYRAGECVSGGFCKASWIAEVFSVDIRNVKASRKFLAKDLGLLEFMHTPQSLLNRFGHKVFINLSWGGSAADKSAHERSALPPLDAQTDTSLPPLEENKKPLREYKHQKPVGGLSGIWETEKDENPSLRHIVPEDLHDTGRLLKLFEEANKEGLIGGSESERLTFVALAERARIVGSTNPPGLFAQLLRRRLFHFVTQDDEEHALKRLRAHIYRDRPTIKPIAPASPALSKDAYFVAVIQAKFSRAGFHGDMFSLVRAEFSEWTKERWERAINEVEQAKKQRSEEAMSRVSDGVSANCVSTLFDASGI